MTTTPPAGTDQNAPSAPGPAADRSGAGPAPRPSRQRTATGESATARTPTATTATKATKGTTRRPTPTGPATGSAAPAAPSSKAAASATGSRPVPAPSSPKRVMGYRRQRFEARKVRRLIRHIDPWSMLKLAVLVSLCMWLITMIACVILWTVADSSGTISSIENFVNSSLQLQDWKLDGEFLFRQFGLITLLMSLGFAAALVVASLVFNLISDIIGGVWISVIEEETARPVSEPAER